MIYGREAELARIDALLDTARRAAGGALVLRGEAGIGKTALLEAARRRAAGVRVLSVCGVETESKLAFAALGQLLAPVLGLRDRLPQRQATALAGALAVGPAAPGDRLAVCAATLGVLRAAAEEQPVLVVVDDAQWLDPASAECVAFAARRLGDARLAMLLALRDGESAPPGIDDLPDLRALPLADAASRALLATTTPDLAPAVRDAIVVAAAGNPLALVELAGQLSSDERTARTPLPEPIRPAGRIGSVFERRVAGLPERARDALVLAAAAGGGDLETLLRACDAAGIAREAIEDAERAGLVALASGRVVFAHPLVRSAAYHAVPAPAQRAAHRALAAVAAGDRRAWHLSAAALGPDEDAAQALQDAGAAAASRCGYAEAAAAYERSAELSADADRRARRLLRACNVHVVGGQMERALAAIETAVALGTPAGQNPRVLHTRGLLHVGTGRFAVGFAMLKGLAEAAAQLVEPPVAAFLLADCAMAALIAGDCRATHSLAERAAEVLGDAGDERARAQVLAALAAGRAFRGEADAARAALGEIERLVARLDPLDWATGVRTHALAIHLCNALEEYERGRAIAGATLAVLDEAGALGARANPLSHDADSAYRLGDWAAAWSTSAEAILLAEETRADETLVRSLVTRARLAAARGLEAEARGLAERAMEIAGRCGIGVIPPYARAALGFLELGLGRVEAAIEVLEPLRAAIEDVHGVVHPSIIPWRPDLCEAYAMAGRHDDARRHAEAIVAEAQAAGGAAGRALAARCRGIVAADFDDSFQEALDLDRERPMPFERARTLLAYGGRLHRARRRVEARSALREAEEILVALGAAPWCERAAAELRAAGAVRRPPRARTADELTPQEIRVAAALAGGATIREAAARLFLSPKTVDFHLQQIYGKLAIRSRAQLAIAAVERGWVAAAEIADGRRAGSASEPRPREGE